MGFLKYDRCMHIWGPLGRHQTIWDFLDMGVAWVMQAARRTHEIHGRPMAIFEPWANINTILDFQSMDVDLAFRVAGQNFSNIWSCPRYTQRLGRHVTPKKIIINT